MKAVEAFDDPRVGELVELCRLLRQGRKGRGRPRYTEPIKDLVRQLVQSGADLAAVANSAGITPQAARRWFRVRPSGATPKVQMLRVTGATAQPDGQRQVLLSLKTSEFEVVVYAAARGLA